ncbi:MAG: hypothetical protein A2V90_02280, partial [Gammaproteobacteria bacterium RBG_16_57_12]
MSRDYKNAGGSKKKSPRGKGGGTPGWMYFAGGLFIGLLVAAVFYFKSSSEAQDKTEVLKKLEIVEGKTTATNKKSSSANNKTTAQHKEEKPRFDFYSILPKLEVVIPESELRDNKPAPGKPREMVSVKQEGTYILQAGAFRQYEEADRVKAELAMLGIEAGIETVTINNSEKWHRVRVGPFRDLNQLNKVRQR